MIAGATEACIHPVSIGGFCRMRALATKFILRFRNFLNTFMFRIYFIFFIRFNDNPSEASRPFDMNRNGFVMSEGAGCIVMESLENALKRKNVTIYGEILGGAINADANHITNPSGDGAYRCMKLALKNSDLTTNQINYINCHATSTPAGDIMEYNAIKRLFTGNNRVFFSSLKGQLGHLLGAAGSVETIFTVLACKKRLALPSINIKELDGNIHKDSDSLKIVLNDCISMDVRRMVALKNSFGFGGTNVSLCLSSYDS